MSVFIVRVELHEAVEEEYEILHKAMSKSGFSRTVLDTNKIEFHLPKAEYGMSADLEPAKVMDVATKAAEQTNKMFGILLTQAQGVTFFNLTPVKKESGSIQHHRSNN
jgi:hypothetical protein